MKITENVYLLDSSKFSHVYLVRGDENILIDTGMPGMAGGMLRELKGLGVLPESIRFILLTHHDVDHVGNARRLQEKTGAQLWISREDEPYLTGALKRPGVKGVISVLSRPQKPAVTGCFRPEQRFGGIRAVRAPGHTPGHTVFQYGDVLFTGDLFRTPGGRFSTLHGFMNWDEQEIKKSIAALRGLSFQWLCPAHGRPVRYGKDAETFFARF